MAAAARRKAPFLDVHHQVGVAAGTPEAQARGRKARDTRVRRARLASPATRASRRIESARRALWRACGVEPPRHLPPMILGRDPDDR